MQVNLRKYLYQWYTGRMDTYNSTVTGKRNLHYLCWPGTTLEVGLLEIRTKSLDFEWSGFQMVSTKAIAIAKAEPFEYQTLWDPTFKKPWFQIIPDFKLFKISNGQISDCVCSRLVRYSGSHFIERYAIQVPILLKIKFLLKITFLNFSDITAKFCSSVETDRNSSEKMMKLPSGKNLKKLEQFIPLAWGSKSDRRKESAEILSVIIPCIYQAGSPPPAPLPFGAFIFYQF